MLPAHHHSVTGVTKARWRYLYFKIKFLKEVVKMGCLCNINVWRRKSGSSMEGFYSHLSCISRIFRPECSFGRRKTTNPCIQVPDFPPRLPGGTGKPERILQIRKKASQPIKNTDTIPCSMSPHSRTTSSRRLQDFPVCSALAPDSERLAILSGTDLYPCFCVVFFHHKEIRCLPIPYAQ